MTDAIEINLGRKPEQLSADADYCSEANLKALENRNIDAYVATGRARDAVAGTVTGEATAAQISSDYCQKSRSWHWQPSCIRQYVLRLGSEGSSAHSRAEIIRPLASASR
jgi:hypothetical protein